MLTLQFVPYRDIEKLNSDEKINKLLGIIMEKEIVLMEGRLKSEEEAELIKKTMELINSRFKGIEICTIYPKRDNLDIFERFKIGLGQLLFGDREGITIIGPATVVKEIKKDPNKIMLLTRTRRRRR